MLEYWLACGGRGACSLTSCICNVDETLAAATMPQMVEREKRIARFVRGNIFLKEQYCTDREQCFGYTDTGSSNWIRSLLCASTTKLTHTT